MPKLKTKSGVKKNFTLTADQQADPELARHYDHGGRRRQTCREKLHALRLKRHRTGIVP